MSVKNSQLAGFLLTQNSSNFLYTEGSTAWLYDCPHHLSPLYIAETNPQNVIALDPGTDQYYVLTSQLIKKDPPHLFEPTKGQTAISPNTFTAQDAGISIILFRLKILILTTPLINFSCTRYGNQPKFTLLLHLL